MHDTEIPRTRRGKLSESGLLVGKEASQRSDRGAEGPTYIVGEVLGDNTCGATSFLGIFVSQIGREGVTPEDRVQMATQDPGADDRVDPLYHDGAAASENPPSSGLCGGKYHRRDGQDHMRRHPLLR